MSRSPSNVGKWQGLGLKSTLALLRLCPGGSGHPRGWPGGLAEPPESARLSLQLGAVYTEGGFVEGVNKKLGLFGDYVDIFKGIPFAAAPKALEKPQRHPGWQGRSRWHWPGPWPGWSGAALLTPTPLAAHRDPEGQGLQEAMPAGHYHPG